MAPPAPSRRSFGEVPIPRRAVENLAWGMIGLPFALPSIHGAPNRRDDHDGEDGAL